MFIAFGVSLVIIALAVFRLLKYYNKTKNYYTADGTVIYNEVQKIEGTLPGDYLSYHYPVIEFIDKNGETKTLVSSQDNPDRPFYQQGDVIKLLVNHNDATRFIFKDIINGYVIPIVWILIGIAVTIFAIVLPKD